MICVMTSLLGHHYRRHLHHAKFGAFITEKAGNIPE